jgi:hypothetical protein
VLYRRLLFRDVELELELERTGNEDTRENGSSSASGGGDILGGAQLEIVGVGASCAEEKDETGVFRSGFIIWLVLCCVCSMVFPTVSTANVLLGEKVAFRPLLSRIPL